MVVPRSSGSQFMALCSSQSGNAHILSQKNSKVIMSLKMNGSCTSACFSPNEKYLFTGGD